MHLHHLYGTHKASVSETFHLQSNTAMEWAIRFVMFVLLKTDGDVYCRTHIRGLKNVMHFLQFYYEI